MPVSPSHPRPAPAPALAFALTLTLVLAAGCEEQRNVGLKAPARPAEPKDTFIVGKRTQEVAKLDRQELARQGGRVASTKITAKDPITLTGNAYVTSIGRLTMDQMEYAVKLFQAENGRYPRDYDEFMAEIIKKNNIGLPKLPFYQKYAYDEPNHKLIVIEYPALKDGPLPQ